MKDKKVEEIIEIKEEVKTKVEKVVVEKSDQTQIVITVKRANIRFMGTNKSRIIRTFNKGEKLKLYREIKSQSVLGSNIW